MKQFPYLFLFIFITTFSLQAQIELDNCTWVNTKSEIDLSSMQVTNSYTKYCTGLQDTLINTKTYRILYYCDDNAYKGALRNDTGHVYFVQKDSANEKILYDFTLKVGDSVSNFYYEDYYQGHGSRITSVDTIWINGKAHKRVSFSSGNSGSWIEGIGCTQGLLKEPYGNISGYALKLHCFSVKDTSYHPQYQTGKCQLDIGQVEFTSEPPISFYPNPVSSSMMINWNGSPQRVSVYDSKGIRIDQISSAKALEAIDMQSYPAGLYFLRIGVKSDRVYKVVKQ